MDTIGIPHRSILTLIAAYLGLFVGLVDANAVNLALPAVRDDLGGGISGAQWTIDAYNIAFAALLLSAGSLGDRFGRRRLLRFGLTVFVVASLACAASPSLPVLLAARAIQGVGAALMLPQGLAITAAVFPGPIERARATAAWAMAAAMSTAIGPILGGVLTDTVGWRYIFWLNVPVGVLTVVLALGRTRESFGPRAALDFVGLNYYSFGYVREDARYPVPGLNPEWTPRPSFDHYEQTDFGWDIYPPGMYEIVMDMAKHTRGVPLEITENGAAYNVGVGADGHVHDAKRIEYTRAHLKELSRAIRDGAPVRGYHHWSLLDNFEWSEGFTQRFGLVHVDFDNGQKRTPKDSADWYAKVIASNKVS